MNYQKVLRKVEQNIINPQTAYEKLYYREVVLPKARFVKIRINVMDSLLATTFARVLFCLPVPIFVFSGLLKFAKKQMGEKNYQLTKDIIGYAKGAKITINTEDAQINLKVF